MCYITTWHVVLVGYGQHDRMCTQLFVYISWCFANSNQQPSLMACVRQCNRKKRNKENSILTVTRVYVCDCLMKCLDCLIDWNDLPSAEDGQHRCLQTLNTVVTHTARLPVDLNVKCNACLPIHLHKHNYHQCACTNQWSPDIQV